MIYYKNSMQEQSLKIRNLVLKQLLFELNQEYQNNTFQVNVCVRHATQSILQHQQDINIRVSKQQANQIRQQINLFVFALQKAPSVWADMLKNDRISSRTTVIPINTTQTLTKVYREIMKQTNKLVNQQRNMKKIVETSQQSGHKQFNFQEQYTNEASRAIMAELLNNLANQIMKFYTKGKNMIHKEEKAVQQEIKHSQIMNPYFLFGILKQMSYITYQKIQEDMSEYFRSLPAETIHIFCRYVQKNYEQIQLSCEQAIPKIFTQSQLKKHIEQQNKFWLDYLGSFQDDQLSLKKIKSQKGDDAIMVINKKSAIKNKDNQEIKVKNQNKNENLHKNEDDSDDDDNMQSFIDAEKLIFKVGEDNQIYITNTKASQKKWQIFNMKDSVSGFYKILKSQITDQASGKIQHEVIAYGVPLGQYANLGGSVGKCLADINKYKSANAFLQDLSTSTIIGGSMSYILSQVPILSYFVIAGGLTYTFYHTVNNKATSKTKKFKQFSKTTVTAVGSVGSAVAGMMLGQTLIPVPFLGAFVGGVIGGFLGQTGSNLMNKLMNKQSFKNLINYLKQEIDDGNHWVYTKKLLSKLGISQKFFRTQICDYETKKDDAYITAICFCVASSYESKRYIARNEKKMKQLQQNKNKIKLKKKSSQLFAEQQTFDNQFNIVRIVDYLTENNVILINDHRDLQKAIKHIAIA